MLWKMLSTNDSPKKGLKELRVTSSQIWMSALIPTVTNDCSDGTCCGQWLRLNGLHALYNCSKIGNLAKGVSIVTIPAEISINSSSICLHCPKERNPDRLVVLYHYFQSVLPGHSFRWNPTQGKVLRPCSKRQPIGFDWERINVRVVPVFEIYRLYKARWIFFLGTRIEKRARLPGVLRLMLTSEPTRFVLLTRFPYMWR